MQAWLVYAALRSAHAAVLCRRCLPAQRMPGAAGSKGSDSAHCAGSARPFSLTVHCIKFFSTTNYGSQRAVTLACVLDIWCPAAAAPRARLTKRPLAPLLSSVAGAAAAPSISPIHCVTGAAPRGPRTGVLQAPALCGNTSVALVSSRRPPSQQGPHAVCARGQYGQVPLASLFSCWLPLSRLHVVQRLAVPALGTPSDPPRASPRCAACSGERRGASRTRSRLEARH